jgi:hypothetical protein
MTKSINYDDNLFSITAQLQNLMELLALNLDAPFFKEKYINDITFFNETLNTFENTLFANLKLIQIVDYLYSLRRSRTGLLNLLQKIELSEKDLTVRLSMSMGKELAHLIETQQRSIDIISSRLKQGIENYGGPETTGEEELTILMASMVYDE